MGTFWCGGASHFPAGSAAEGGGGGAPASGQNPDCIPDEDVPVSGIPPSDADRRHEDITELLTGERQTGDEEPIYVTTNVPNFAGVWGDFEGKGEIVVAVLDCSKVDANELDCSRPVNPAWAKTPNRSFGRLQTT